MPGVCSSICTISDSGAEANTSASISPASSAIVAGVCSSWLRAMRLASMLLASNNLSIRRGTPLPAVPTFRRRPCSCDRADRRAWALSLRGRVFAVEQPDRLDEQAAERFDAVLFAGCPFVAAALHEAQIGLALAQQAQVVRGALAGQQHHVDAVAGQGLAVALAKLVVRALRRSRGQRHAPGRRRVQPQVGEHQQRDGERDDRAGRNQQVADRQQRVANRLGHRVRDHGPPAGAVRPGPMRAPRAPHSARPVP